MKRYIIIILNGITIISFLFCYLSFEAIRDKKIVNGEGVSVAFALDILIFILFEISVLKYMLLDIRKIKRYVKYLIYYYFLSTILFYIKEGLLFIYAGEEEKLVGLYKNNIIGHLLTFTFISIFILMFISLLLIFVPSKYLIKKA